MATELPVQEEVEESGSQNIFTTTVDAVVNWARKSSLWPMPFGTACCAIEFMGSVSSTYDLARFGAEVVRFSPRQSDLMMVMGTITDKMAPVMKRIYDQMPEPKWVISMGACATSGGFYRSYNVMQGIDELIPVDVYIPGCPPPPEAVLQAVIKIQEKIQEQQAFGASAIRTKPRAFLKDATVTELDPPSNALLSSRAEIKSVDNPIVAKLVERFGESVIKSEDYLGNLSVTIKQESAKEVCQFLRDDPSLKFNFLMDICGVDYLKGPDRYEVVYHLYALDSGNRLRLKARVNEREPKVDSVTSLWKTADWFEREAFDLYGIKFNGHPDLRRILTHSQFEGHPMRRDYRAGLRHWHDELPDLPVASSEAPPVPDPLEDEHMIINIGPSHPTMHGTFRVEARMDGETIVHSDLEIGYLHRNFEKMAETHTYWGVLPYTDRLNYMSAFMNGVGYCMAIEKMMNCEVPDRVKVIRMILSELSRVTDHLVCIGTNLVDIGAFSNFWYTFEPRERVYSLFDKCAGGRIFAAYNRIGGLANDIPEDFVADVKQLLKDIPGFIETVNGLVTHNAIIRNRFKNVGVMSAENAISWGWTGPCLRGSGVAYDIRKVHPYYFYDQVEFDVPIGVRGDCYDRYLVRMEEMYQSLRIVKQLIDNIPSGKYITDDRKVALPPKQGVYTNIEDLMNHFKLVMHGILPPVGEVYSFTEAGNGELGYYVVSDGTKHPYRIKVRPPCFPLFASYREMINGGLLSDAVAILGGLNIIAGELDR